MKSRITKLATAAAILVIASLSITYFGKFTSTAYALQQTIEACHSVRYLHIVNLKAGEEEPKEFWIECDELGQIKNARMHIPQWDSPEDGAKRIVWKENKAQIYLKKKNILATIRDKTVADAMLKFLEKLDPRLAVERLREQQEEGKVKIEIDKPADKSEPIVVTATSVKQDDSPFQRMVLFVDQATKLVISVELYKLKEGTYHKEDTFEYYDYNQPIEAKMFSLEDEIPADVMRMDQTAQEVGLLQGQLSDKEIAVELVRQFLQALIDRDYAKAGRLFSGVPADRMEKTYGEIRFIRIISIGEPVSHSLTGGLYVPCTVEIEKNGEISQWHPKHSYVRQVHGQPNRWEIIGGFLGI